MNCCDGRRPCCGGWLVRIICRCALAATSFCWFAPHTDNESALGLEQDLRLGLAAVSDEALTVSASIGVATVETAGNTLADVYRVADHNMYREKRTVHAQGADC
ncbi:diguanylate cyclase [Collinsella sp. AM38-1BH]|uniref:GGDEF domain-containing protein n=1 Tax=Collinsella sp. AM38-1BH TaxID=2292318 RepID=UPI000FF68FCE|nr:diguanylate cyclase [Collinsella sp. AM38-1BH]